jgi:hypothetical protein
VPGAYVMRYNAGGADYVQAGPVTW